MGRGKRKSAKNAAMLGGQGFRRRFGSDNVMADLVDLKYPARHSSGGHEY
jgi:hypothetical protein